MVESAWKRWAKRAKLARKVRTAVKANITDGQRASAARPIPCPSSAPRAADPLPPLPPDFKGPHEDFLILFELK